MPCLDAETLEHGSTFLPYLFLRACLRCGLPMLSIHLVRIAEDAPS